MNWLNSIQVTNKLEVVKLVAKICGQNSTNI